MDFSYYIMDEEVYADMKMTFQPKKKTESKSSWIPCENEQRRWKKSSGCQKKQKVEQNYLLNERGRNRVIDCGLS